MDLIKKINNEKLDSKYHQKIKSSSFNCDKFQREAFYCFFRNRTEVLK